MKHHFDNIPTLIMDKDSSISENHGPKVHAPAMDFDLDIDDVPALSTVYANTMSEHPEASGHLYLDDGENHN